MPRFKDISGQTFNRVLVLYRKGHAKDKHITWWCRCSCGAEFECPGNALIRGNTKSCGCLSKELTIKRSTKHGAATRKNKHPIYRNYHHMLERCYNPNNKNYNLYGARGITVCETWKNDFSTFFNWALSNNWQQGLSIDRIDNNGNYYPENCRWSTQLEQCNNQNKNIVLTYQNKTQTLSQWARELNMPYACLYDRYLRKLPVEKVLTPKHFYNFKKEQ